jgi:hypothetical protein
VTGPTSPAGVERRDGQGDRGNSAIDGDRTGAYDQSNRKERQNGESPHDLPEGSDDDRQPPDRPGAEDESNRAERSAGVPIGSGGPGGGNAGVRWEQPKKSEGLKAQSTPQGDDRVRRR